MGRLKQEQIGRQLLCTCQGPCWQVKNGCHASSKKNNNANAKAPRNDDAGLLVKIIDIDSLKASYVMYTMS